MATRPTFYILDAFSLIFQVFHAIRGPRESSVMTGPAGQPTEAVFGIFRDMLNLVRDKKPDYIAVAFDGPGPVFRSEIFAEYKATRKEMPIDLVPQIPVIRTLFDGFRMPVFMEPLMEADDLIATLARRGQERGLDVFIVTADKDARQLISDNIRIYNIRKNTVIDAAALEADWGIRPDQVVDYLSLVGDSVDNVPGVPGIGPGFASSFLKEFGTLDNLLANPEKVKGPKKQQALREHKETALRARQLVALKDDIPLSLDWEALKIQSPDITALKTLCDQCGFHRFRDELSKGETPSAAAPPKTWTTQYHTIDSADKFESFLEQLRAQPRFCIDTETTAIDPLRSRLVGLSFSWEAGVAYYLPVRGPMGAAVLNEQATLEALRPILTNPAVEKIGQNIKYDILALGRAQMPLAGPFSDTMVLSYLLESGERNHNLDQLSKRLLDHDMIPISDLIGKGKTQLRMDHVSIDKVAEYAGEDADATLRIEEILSARVKSEGLWNLYADLERPLISVLARMEQAGIAVDSPRLKQLSHEYAGRITALETEVYSIAGRTFNVNSGPQLRQVLFDELKLPSLQKTPGGEQSTSQEVLEELALKHPFPALLIQHRQLSKLKSTYLDALPELVHPDDGRIHASFNQSVAATGRLSSSDPNLQNIPVRTEEGRQIRQAFIADRPGWVLLAADYSQIELRILAHYSADPALCRAFEEGRDVHSAVASRIFAVTDSDVSESQRRVAKTVNFGVVYGLSAFGLASRLGISQTEAATFIEAYFQEYSGVDRFITKTLEGAKSAGRVETILGRRRPIVGIKATTGRTRNLAERTAINTVIQGSAADLIKRAMIVLDERLRSGGFQARMLLQIHDELVFEAPESEIPRLAALVRETMTTALDLNVKLAVDIAAGPNWLDVASIP